jgi:hypothetical protein
LITYVYEIELMYLKLEEKGILLIKRTSYTIKRKIFCVIYDEAADL